MKQSILSIFFMVTMDPSVELWHILETPFLAWPMLSQSLPYNTWEPFCLANHPLAEHKRFSQMSSRLQFLGWWLALSKVWGLTKWPTSYSNLLRTSINNTLSFCRIVWWNSDGERWVPPKSVLFGRRVVVGIRRCISIIASMHSYLSFSTTTLDNELCSTTNSSTTNLEENRHFVHMQQEEHQAIDRYITPTPVAANHTTRRDSLKPCWLLMIFQWRTRTRAHKQAYVRWFLFYFICQ